VIDVFGNTEPDKFGNRKVAIGALHVLHQEPSFANATAVTGGYLYALQSSILKRHLMADSKLATEVVHSLAVEVRRQSNQVRWLMRTPLLEQRPKKTNVIAVSLAALIESFYRSVCVCVCVCACVRACICDCGVPARPHRDPLGP
jgi:hypothetical protein